MTLLPRPTSVLRTLALAVASTTIALTARAQAAPAAAASAQGPVRMNRAIELLSSGQSTFGIFSHDRSLDNARLLSRSGLDFVLIDMEHGPLDVETLRTFLLGMTDKRRVLEKGNMQPDVTPIVRIAPNGRDQASFIAKQVLDVGAMGVMFPYINTKEEALQAVRSVRYPQKRGAPDFEPQGIRGSAPGNAVWLWGVSDYTDRADVWPLDPRGDLMAVIQIETAEAVKNVSEILSVPGISAIFVGPADLAMSLGGTGEAGAAELEAAIQTVLRACKAKNIPIGITTNAQTVERRIKEGFNFVTVSYGDGGITPATATALQLGRTAAGRR
ncbi:MAG TPA: aldolase [Gemmatimonas aurantiaca]|nr:aldolase/citrate lyase family protein [Gemmatimonas aurantiaca]HCT57627.1 aldolase [Gemmatimonas aurantiaca]